MNPPPYLRSPWRLFALCACAALPVACGGTGGEGSATAYAAEQLVVGDWADETGLLVLWRDGGRPELRATADPSRVVWQGRSRLPAAETAGGLDERTVLFRTPRADAYRYDPSEDRSDPLRGVGTAHAWGAFRRTSAFWAAGEILIAGEGGTRTHEAPGPVLWASEAPDGSVVALVVGDAGPKLVLLDETSEQPSELALDVRPPGLIAGWGGSVLFVSAEGEEIVSVRLPEIEIEARFDLESPVTALALSASTHELYVALAGGRVKAVNRADGGLRDLARVDVDVTEIRPGIYGQQILAFGGGRVLRISLVGERPIPLDSDWRPDLPLGLPSGDLLIARGDTVFRTRVGAGAARASLERVDGPAAAWWLPVRWNPSTDLAAASRRADAVADGEASAEGLAAEAEQGLAPDDGLEGAASGDQAEMGAGADLPAIDSLGFAFAAPAAGYYAVAVAAQTPGGVIQLIGSLSRSGYPTALQRRRDDGGQMWYRALVGPYPERARAEAAARQLRRERSLDAWVTEVTAGAEGEF